MQHKWTNAMVFALIGVMLVSLAACKDKNTEQQPGGNEEVTTVDPLIGNQGQAPGNQFDNGMLPPDTEAQTQPVIILPDNQNPGNNQNNNQTTTDSTGLSFTSNGNGTCTLTGLGACRDICVVIPTTSPAGDRVTAIGAQAFYNCTTVSVIQIPATVNSIGHLAFGGCTGLVYITVSAQNTSYKDVGGVLYSADGKTLVHYPAASGASSVNVPAGVTKIEDMAFYGCKSLKMIRYGGTQEAWSHIAVGSMNYSLNAASVTCSDSGK